MESRDKVHLATIRTNGEHAEDPTLHTVYEAVLAIRSDVGEIKKSINLLRNSDFEQNERLRTSAWPSALPMWILVAMMGTGLLGFIVVVSHRW